MTVTVTHAYDAEDITGQLCSYYRITATNGAGWKRIAESVPSMDVNRVRGEMEEYARGASVPMSPAMRAAR